MRKFILPNLKAHLVQNGLTITKFRQKVHSVVGDDDVSARTWANVLNRTGAGETSVNVIIDVTRRTFAELQKPCPEIALTKVEVSEPGSNKPSGV